MKAKNSQVLELNKPETFENAFNFACRWYKRITSPIYSEKSQIALAEFLAKHASPMQLFFIDCLCSEMTVQEIFAETNCKING